MLEEKIQEQLGFIEESIRNLGTKIDKLQVIHIENGGGRQVSYKRDEFFQMLYDRPKAAFLGAASFSEKAMKILKFLGWMAMIGYVISNTIK